MTNVVESRPSNVCPAAQQIGVHTGQLYGTGIVGQVARNPLDCHVEIEEERALAVIANQALDPEEKRVCDCRG
jgi:hypothetical protein